MPDEPPIRVRNGSMTIALVSSEWKPSGQSWTPADGTNAGGFIVVVEVVTRSGRVMGQPVFGKEVEIFYSDGAVIRFKRGPLRRRPRSRRSASSRRSRTRYWSMGNRATGYITGVEVKDRSTSWRCAFKSRAALSEIDIYPLPHTLRRNQARARRKK